LYENDRDIFEKVWIVCVEYLQYFDSLLDYWKKKNWQLGCHDWDNLYVRIKIVLPKLASSTPTSLYLIHSHVIASKFYEWLESSAASTRCLSLLLNWSRWSRSHQCWPTARSHRLSLRAEIHSPPFKLAYKRWGPAAVEGILDKSFENIYRQRIVVLKNCTVCFSHKFFRTEVVPVILAVQIFVPFVVIAWKRGVAGLYFVPKDPHQIDRTVNHWWTISCRVIEGLVNTLTLFIKWNPSFLGRQPYLRNDSWFYLKMSFSQIQSLKLGFLRFKRFFRWVGLSESLSPSQSSE